MFLFLPVCGLYAGAGVFLLRRRRSESPSTPPTRFPPLPHPPSPPPPTKSNSPCRQWGHPLRQWLHPRRTPPSAAPSSGVGSAGCKLVVYFGGNAEEVSGNLDNPIPAKAAQLFVNYRGFGDSDGKPSAGDFEKDALTLFDQASEKFEVAPEEICVFGRSLGTHMAAVVAAQRPVSRAVMISPFDSVLNIAKARYPIFPVRALLRHPFVTSQYAPRAKAPALFVLAESDWVVPRKRSEALIELWQAPKQVVVIPNATHNNFDSSEYRRAVSEFLNGNESE